MMNSAEQYKITESFYKYQVLYFVFIGMWKLPPNATRRQRQWHRLRGWLFLGIVAIMMVFFMIRVLGNIDQLRVILEVLFIFVTEVSCVVKLLNIRLKQQQHDDLIQEMHDSAFKAVTPRELDVFKSVAQMAKNMRNVYALLSLLAAGMILLLQGFGESRSLPMSMYEPCDVASSGCFYGLYAYHVLALLPTCWLNIAFDSTSQALLNFLRAQLIMLSMRLENLGAVETPKDDERIALELRDCCVYYNRIVRLRDMVDGFIKIPVSIQLLCSILVLVSNFYVISINMDNKAIIINTSTYQLAMLQQIFIVCYAANEVTDQSSLLGHALYKAEWTTWNRRNRKMCLLMMLRFNSPICVRTINHTQYLSLPTFASIVNCSYSYFALLKRVNG